MPKHFPSNPTHRHGVAERGNPRSDTVPANTNASSEGGGSHPSGTNANPKVIASTNPHSSSSPLSAESITLARLRQKSISHPMQQCQLTIYVPPHTVGAIIGRGGRTILSVQREAMRRSAGHVAPVRISVGSGSSGASGNSSNTANGHATTADGEQTSSYGTTSHGYNEYYGGINQPGHQQQQHNQNDDTTHSTDNDDDDDDDEDDWTPVIIRGDPVGCFSAVRQILPLVDRDHDPDIVFEVPIHRAKHNMLVGKGGVILAALSATYETRIMIPPNEFMSNVGGGGNFWKKRQEMSNMTSSSGGDAGSAMLFGDSSSTIAGAGGGNQQALMNSTVSNNPAGSTLPPNVIQLEGDIDKIEQCLVKMLSIVSGERWIPTGVIVEKATPEVNTSSVKKNASSDSTASSPKSASPTASSSGKGSGNKDETTAEAVIVKIWTPSSKLLNLGKIRKVQRKTNTVIRRKKLRFNGHYDEAKGGGVAATEREEEVEEDSGEPGLMTEEDDEGVPSDISASGPKTATKYIITGKTESVKSAAAQFEKILGLEPGSSKIIDTTHKTNSMAEKISEYNKDVSVQQAGLNKQADGESDTGNDRDRGPPGKKARRKKKNRGKGPPKGSNAKEGAAPPQSQVTDA